jgi:flagellum-specific ATP synthase
MNLTKYGDALEELDPVARCGRVTQVIGLLVETQGPEVSLGEICKIRSHEGKTIRAEAVGFRDNKVLLMAYDDLSGIARGDQVLATGRPLTMSVSDELLGRVVDGLGRPIDGGPPLPKTYPKSVKAQPPQPLKRPRIEEPLSVGVKAIDSLITIGKGQRMGVFSGSGVGKSTLLGMMARNTTADVNVIALVGERGREVKEFIDKNLGHALARSVVVVATSDEPALVRVNSSLLATSIAEHFRDKGCDVLLIMDSLTRIAMAQREIGTSIGEPTVTKGYTPSVFSLLPRLLERSGTSERGTITGIYSVLVDGDDMDEPISDAARGILDGHIVLSRALAVRNHYPAIDVLASISRLMNDIVSDEQLKVASEVRQLMATYREAEDLINIGAYVKGSNSRIDRAITHIDRIETFLRQSVDGNISPEETLEEFKAILK